MWDLQTGASHILEGHTDRVKAVCLTPDGRRGVSGSWDGTVRVWDLDSGDSHVLLGHTVTPDGRYVVSGTVVSLAPEGRRAVSGSHDKTVRVWDLNSGESRILQGHTGTVDIVCVTPDARCAISGSDDHTLRVWDLDSGVTIAVYCSSGGSVCALAEHFPIIVAGTMVGRVERLRLLGSGDTPLPLLAPRIATSSRLWFGTPGVAGGCWDDFLSAICTACGQRFETPAAILDTIASITHNACLSPQDNPFPVRGPARLPAEAWDEPRLISACPLCHEPLKFNPFVVDNRDRYA